MVVEFPLNGCIAKSASAANRKKMTRAKAQLLSARGTTHQPRTSTRKLTGAATITGTGFSDKRHGQGGGADNGIVLRGARASDAFDRLRTGDVRRQ
jgi:hypothetical protein